MFSDAIAFSNLENAHIVLTIDPGPKFTCIIRYGPGQQREAVGKSELNMHAAFYEAMTQVRFTSGDQLK